MFENLPKVTRVGIKMSGGADSSLLAYLLAKYIAHSKLDILKITGKQTDKYKALIGL
jgi:tRNA(Ile)-lysidine synthase TilS/MesJ